MLHSQNKNFAFTIVEVLITLAIIGVVSAITIPSLIHKYRKSLVENRMKQFYSTVNQAIKLSEDENGEVQGWDFPKHAYNTTEIREFLNKYILPYLSGNIQFSNNVFLRFPNGVNTYWEGGFPGTINIYVRFLDNKLEKNVRKGTGGIDYFHFQLKHENRVITPYRYNYSGNYCTNGADCCYAGVQGDHNDCAKVIMRNGWKIPADYPFKF
jgi:prepilin-type N-terminal cleavage/methylation domain-containing protein